MHSETRGHIRSPHVACDLHGFVFVARSPVFLLSPARLDGRRAQLLLNPRAQFSLAVRLREPDGAELGEVFSFLSGLYFRGKLAYAQSFARTAGGVSGVMVITPCEGLRSPDMRVGRPLIRRYAGVDIDAAEPKYRRPLMRDARALASALGPEASWQVVLLGSVASGKYVEPLMEVF